MKHETPPMTSDQQASFFLLVKPQLERLSHFVDHVIRFAEARGDLVPGQVVAADVVDAALLRACEEYLKKPVRGEIQRWLIQFAAREVETEIRRSKRERNHAISTEENIPETPPAEEVTTLGEEILYFYQPDEDLKVEDVIPDLEVPTSEELAETRELRGCVRSALASMPRDNRRVLLFHYVQGLRGRELARLIGKPPSDVARLLEDARTHLRQKLIDAGCTLRGGGEPSIQPAQILDRYAPPSTKKG
jgi:RNA polymerase sigma factor (sigma-70 family)